MEFITPFAALVRERLPEIRIEVLASVEHIDLSRGGADLAVRTRLPREPELMTLHSETIELGVFASESYAARLPERPDPAQLDWVTWSFPYLHVEPRPQLERLIPNFAPAFASDDYLVLKRAVIEGLGAMILDRTSHPLAASLGLVKINTGLDLPASEMHLVCAKSMQYVGRVRAIADLLIDQMQWTSGG